MVCVGLSERDLQNFGGARQNFGEAVAPPSSTPAATVFRQSYMTQRPSLFTPISYLVYPVERINCYVPPSVGHVLTPFLYCTLMYS